MRCLLSKKLFLPCGQEFGVASALQILLPGANMSTHGPVVDHL